MERDVYVSNLEYGSIYYNERLNDIGIVGYKDNMFIYQSTQGVEVNVQFRLTEKELYEFVVDMVDYDLIGYV